MLVVDASVAIKWFLLEPGRDGALRLLNPGHQLIAPELIVAEVTNALWRRTVAGQVTSRQASPR